MIYIFFSDITNRYEFIYDYNDTTTNGYRDCKPYYPIY